MGTKQNQNENKNTQMLKGMFIKSNAMKTKQGYEKSPGNATITNRSPSQTQRGRGNKQNQTSANLTNVRKAPRLALSSPSEVIAMLKGLTNTRTK